MVLILLFISSFSNMKKRIKMILFILLFVILWLPFIQEQTKYFKEATLKGAFVTPVMPGFSLDSLKSLEFQEEFEHYENYNFGFRGLMVKIKNSFNYLFFN